MAFAKVPKFSKSRINLAGKALSNKDSNDAVPEEATSIAEAWRACHAYPINTFQSTLRRKLSKFSNNPLVAQRLKRMPTIIEKLHRYPKMQLARMQDIGGVRAILYSMQDVNLLAKEYKDKSRFAHELVGESRVYYC